MLAFVSNTLKSSPSLSHTNARRPNLHLIEEIIEFKVVLMFVVKIRSHSSFRFLNLPFSSVPNYGLAWSYGKLVICLDDDLLGSLLLFL